MPIALMTGAQFSTLHRTDIRAPIASFLRAMGAAWTDCRDIADAARSARSSGRKAWAGLGYGISGLQSFGRL